MLEIQFYLGWNVLEKHICYMDADVCYEVTKICGCS